MAKAQAINEPLVGSDPNDVIFRNVLFALKVFQPKVSFSALVEIATLLFH